MYSCYEIYDEFLDQYGTNIYRDLSHLTSSVDELPIATINLEPALDLPNHSEPEINLPTRQLSFS